MYACGYFLEVGIGTQANMQEYVFPLLILNDQLNATPDLGQCPTTSGPQRRETNVRPSA